jgi:putative transcriptional regulator
MTSDNLAGRLLVATPAMEGSIFDRTVVLMLEHEDDGSLGIVLNRPTAVDVREVLPPWAELTAQPGVVFQGGPVALDSALGVAVAPGSGGPDGVEPLGWRQVTGELGLVDLDAPPELLAVELTGLRIFAGYAGWSPGQLAAELEVGAWYVVDAEPGDAFTDTPDRLWRSVLRRQQGWLAVASTAPHDPSLN